MKTEEKIGFVVAGRELAGKGRGRLSIRLLESTRGGLVTNEVPIILNALRGSSYLDPDAETGTDNGGFTYRFPFRLG